jgi:hypothetical protein
MRLELAFVLALAAWRVAHMLVNERGILAISERIRTLAGVYTVTKQHTLPGGQQYESAECAGDNELAKMLCCVWCTSVWTSAGMLALWCVGTGLSLSLAEAVVWWLAIAALCIVCEKVNRYV